jgi:Zn finger protein HypA/HybF involved in hydrogenase expression
LTNHLKLFMEMSRHTSRQEEVSQLHSGVGTPLEGSLLIVKEVPIEVYCPSCRMPKTLKSMQLFCCPDCGTQTPEVIHGKELTVTALELKQ